MGSLCRVDGKTSCRKIPGQPALPTPDRVFPDGTLWPLIALTLHRLLISAQVQGESFHDQVKLHLTGKHKLCCIFIFKDGEARCDGPFL